MADFRPLLWDPSGPVKRRFGDTDTLLLDTDGTNNILDLQVSASSVFTLSNSGVLTRVVGGTNPFTAFDGNPATGATGNVNNDSTLGESLRVTVEGATRWIPAFTDPDMDNIGGSGTLDDAYNASGGASTVDVDAGTLTWTVTNPYDFIVQDGSTATKYIDIDTSVGDVTVNTSTSYGGIHLSAGGSNADISLTTAGSSGDIFLTSGSTIPIVSTMGTSISAGTYSSWSVTSGNLNLTAGGGTLNLDGLYVTSEASRGLTLLAGKDNGGYGFNLVNEGYSASYVQTTNGGDLYIYADTTDTNADITLQSGGNTTLSCGRTLNIHVDTAGYDMSLTVPDHASGDLFFAAHASGNIPFNSVADPTLNTTAQNIVGAINEVAASGSTTLDDAYNNSSGASTIAVDAGDVTWNVSGGSSFNVALLASSTDQTVLEVSATTTASSAHGISNIDSILAAGTSSTGDLRAYSATLSGTTTGTTYAYHVSDADFDYGLYSAAPTYVTHTYSGSNIAELLSDFRATSTGVTGGANEIYGLQAYLTSHANDLDIEYVGFHATYIANAPASEASAYAIKVGDTWDYGFHSYARVYMDVSNISTTTIGADLQLTSNSLGAVQSAAVCKLTYTENGTDDVSSIPRGLHIVGDATSASVSKQGILIDTGWDYGLWIGDTTVYGIRSASPVYVAKTLTSAFTSYEAAPSSSGSTGIGDVYGFKVAFGDNAGDTNATYTAFDATSNGVGGTARYGLKIDDSFGYGVYSESLVLALNQGSTSGTARAFYTLTTSGGMTSTLSSVNGYAAAVQGHASDTAGYAYGFTAGNFVDNGGSLTSSRAFYSGSDWDYGLYAESKALVTSPEINASVIEAQSLPTTAMPAFQGRIAITADATGHVSDSGDSSLRGVYVTSDAVGSAGRFGVDIDDNWDYGLKSLSKCWIQGTDISDPILLVEPSATTAMSSFQHRTAVSADLSGHASDAADSVLRGVYLTSDAVGSADRFGVQIDNSWDYGINTQSRVYSIYVLPDANPVAPLTSGAVMAEAHSPAGGFTTSNGTGAGFVINLVDHASDVATARYYGYYAASEDNSSSATKYGYYAHSSLDYALYGVDSHVELDADFSEITEVTKGIINVLSSNTVALSDTQRYGIRVYHSGNGSDSSSSSIYNFYADSDGASPAADIGFYADDGLDRGFYANGIGSGAFYCAEGSMIITGPSSGYAPTTSSGALLYTNITSSGFTTSGTWYNNASRYTYSASDTSGTWFGYFAETSGTAVAGVQAVGFRAQANLDIGVMSYSPENRFQRIDDSSTTTQPTVLIENGDNDSSGGTASALKVANSYNSTSGTTIEIDHAYDGSNLEDTRRAIVFSSAQTNMRRIPLALGQPHMTSSTTSDWTFNGNYTGTHIQRWTTTSTTAKYISIPFTIPHNCTLTGVRVRVYHTNTCTAAPTMRLCKHLTSGGAILIASQTGVTTAATTQFIAITGQTEVVANTGNDYFIMYNNGTHSSSSVDYIYMAEVTYEITDFAAGCGW